MPGPKRRRTVAKRSTSSPVKVPQAVNKPKFRPNPVKVPQAVNKPKFLPNTALPAKKMTPVRKGPGPFRASARLDSSQVEDRRGASPSKRRTAPAPKKGAIAKRRR